MFRDVIWTLIVIWLVYRLVDLFKQPARRNAGSSAASGENPNQTSAHSHSRDEIKKAVQKHVNSEGEYVEFEEIRSEKK